ncbi:DUF2617 family protein [Streptomyces spiramenti]|uniref:DUF2617 family protein n=1 Tax=Streptomyces spiramenti TaxID=2720606 RepID=A0ABX1ALA3_9ACTN|nr:DUF2617 family protein [Streptomyces spiramenti]NJP67883.1 DUF2617 family protein [Streptomyces spiramenti]
MTAATLETPYLDSSPEDLSLALGLPDQEALLTTEVPVDGVTVRLRLLGASHQVFAGPIRETVACLGKGVGEGLPAVLERDMDGWSYRFASHTRRCSPAAFTSRVQRLRETLADRDDALFGVFPGAPDAVTALSVRPAEDADHGGDGAGPRVEWRTWHTYPRSLEIVETRTVAVSR